MAVKNQFLRISGFSACFLAMFLASGGHWAVLQSVAWARMIVLYARDYPLPQAIAMTFDGRHPCEMCGHIQKGRQAEENAPPVIRWDRQPEFLPTGLRVTVPMPATLATPQVAFVPSLHSEFLPAPPKPPPRFT